MDNRSISLMEPKMETTISTATQAPLAIGQQWAHPKPGPWGGTEGPAAEIIDVRDGWVRYSWAGDPDRRDTESEFRRYFSVLLPDEATA